MNLLSTGNPKTMKGEKQGYLTFILHLAPSTLSGFNTCPKATTGCAAACLNTAGRGGMFKKGEFTNMIQKARIRKTRLFFTDRSEFMDQLAADIRLGIKQAAKKGLIPVFRLNGTSDIAWEKIRYGYFRSIMIAFPMIQFYDYTKIAGRTVPANYHLTFSAADGNEADVAKAMNQGYNVTVVFGIKKTDAKPASYLARPVFDGDESDLRFLDPIGMIIGLFAKGRGKKDTTGFVKYLTA